MANAARRTVRYKPRYSDMEAYELLPPEVRRALQEACSDWSAASCLRFTRKYGWKRTVDWIRQGDSEFMKKWIPGSGRKKPEPSPCAVLGIAPLRANWMFA